MRETSVKKNDPHRTRIAAKNRLPVRFPKKTKSERGESKEEFSTLNAPKSKLRQQTNEPIQT